MFWTAEKLVAYGIKILLRSDTSLALGPLNINKQKQAPPNVSAITASLRQTRRSGLGLISQPSDRMNGPETVKARTQDKHPYDTGSTSASDGEAILTYLKAETKN